MNVEQIVCATLEEIIIDISEGRVLLRDLVLAGIVCFEDCLEALCLAGIAGGRLSAAADAAVGAGHDFNEVKVLFSALDLLDQLVGIAEAVGNCDAKVEVTGGNLECLDAFQTTDTAFGNRLEGIGGCIIQHTADDGFRHTTRDAEDDAGTGVVTERIIRFGIRQVGKVDTGSLDQAAQLIRCEDEVDQALAVLLQFGTLCFELLGGAGHDCYGIDILILELLTDQGTEHLHRAAAGGYLRHQVRMCLLNMLDPAGAAGGEHRELCTVFHFLKELGAFFHNGKVGGKVRVIDHVKAEAAERRDELAGDRLIGGHAELFCQADTDGRCKLNNDTLVRIVEHLPHLGDLAVDGESTRRADCRTLAAAYTAGLDQHLAEARSYHCLLAALCKVNRADVLDLSAHTYAKAAEDALGRISRDAGRRNVQAFTVVGVLLETRLLHVVTVGVLLELAAAALFTGKAVSPVAAHQELQGRAAAFQHLFGVGVNHKTVSRLHGAGSIECAAVILYQAETASAVNGKVFAIAQGRNINAVMACNFKDIALIGERAFNPVNDHFLF